MCNCIKEIEQKILEAHPVYNKKKVESVTGHVIYLFTDTGVRKATATEFELTLEGQKKKHPVTVNHTFCPYCGEKYLKDDTNDSTGK